MLIFQDSPKYLPEMFKGLESYDLVLGSRYVAGGGSELSLKRKIISPWWSFTQKNYFRSAI